MTDIKNFGLKYGGYTSLDKVYLDQLLAGKTEQEQLVLITPPPSVVNPTLQNSIRKRVLRLRRIILQNSVRN